MLYLGLGSNLGDKRDNLLQAVALISERVGRIVCLSRFYMTDPWGYSSSNFYSNKFMNNIFYSYISLNLFFSICSQII